MNTPFEFDAPEGKALTADLFARGNDTPVQSNMALTEETNRAGTYAGTITVAASGWHKLHVSEGANVIGVIEQPNLIDNNVLQFFGDYYTDEAGAPIDKDGYKLASDGLDAVSVTAPVGVASNFREMVVALWRRFYSKATKDATEIKTYSDDGSTSLTTQAISDDGTTETQGQAV